MAIPLGFVIAFWLVEFLKYQLQWDLSWLGLRPRELDGLLGILSSPFVHGSTDHLLSNMLPFLVLGTMLIYFYRRVALRAFFGMYIVTGLLVWIFARSSTHIGASGVVYALAGFVVGAAIHRGNRRALALGLIVIFVYGSMIWGVLPIEPGVSWESHLFGFVVGLATARFFRKELEPEEEKEFYLFQVPDREEYFLPRDIFEEDEESS